MDFKLDDCGGCTTCEIACSLKQTGQFNHGISGIQIVEEKDGQGYFVRIIEDPSTGRIPCDGCMDIDGDPMCVRYCHKADELRGIISKFIDARKKEVIDNGE